MKVFKLNKVKYKNIMSVGQQAIEIQLDKVQKSLVTGKNGGGKSTILEAITFALFGKPFRDIKKGQLVNTFNKKEMLVELWMQYDGHEFYIKRGQKPNVFEIQRDGTTLDESASVRDFQEHFETLIGMSYSSFKQIVVLGTAGYTPFMGLSTPARRKLVEDLLEVSMLADMDKLNKSSIREINSNIQVIDVKKESVINQIKIHADNAERQKKMSDENIGRLQVMYDDLVKEAMGHKAAINSLNDELLALVIGDDPGAAVEQVTSKFHAITSRIDSYNRVVTLYGKGGNCPTCLQELHSESGLVDKINSHVKTCENNKLEIQKEKDELLVLLSEYNKRRQRGIAIKSDIETHKASAISIVDKAKRVKAAIDKTSQEFIDNSDEIEKLQKESNVLVEQKSSMMMEKYHRGILAEMLKDSGIKGAIIKKYIPMFNKHINQYLKIMEADYVFTLDEEFNETIKSRGREEFSYASFSQGEKARIDIALLFTWKDIAQKVSGVKISTLILDEVYDGAFDTDGIKHLSTILNNLRDSNIFIISHKDHDPQDYGQHLQMKKVGRFSVMETN